MHVTTALKAAIAASASIMQVYEGDFSAQYKSDGSPVTVADKQADAIIRKHLQSTGLPVISEESKLLPYETRRHWSRLWLVDPLDGTKEFLKRNGEFTVNIALIENGKPVMGVITAPVTGRVWIGAAGPGLYMVGNMYDGNLMADPEKIFDKLKAHTPSRALAHQDVVRIVVSRSHPDNHTETMIKHLEGQGKRVRRVPRGSSLKLCEIAMGQADIYTRFGPTMEWDIAAGHAILQAAGGDVVDMQSGKPLIYNKPDMLNPYFVASNGNLPEGLMIIIRHWHANPQK